MNKATSLRETKEPTQSEIQNPHPGPATTKGTLFGKHSLSGAIRRGAAALGPEMARNMSKVIKLEKNVMRAFEQASAEKRSVAKQLSLWGEGHEDDISDITDKVGVLIYEIAELEDLYVARYDQYRLALKTIRNVEASAQPTRERKQKLVDEIAALKYKEPESPRLAVLESELVRAEAESLVAEAQLSNITRERLKAAYWYWFDALTELSEKLLILLSYGKALVNILDDSQVTPGEARPRYVGHNAAKQLIQQAESALQHWKAEEGVQEEEPETSQKGEFIPDGTGQAEAVSA